MAKKSMGKNFIYSLLKTIMGTIFPLITFPYVSRVLGPEGTGKIDYVQAKITYFTLIAAFGISGYAIREGARIRDDKKKMNSFVGEILGINLVTVLISYGLCLWYVLRLGTADYRSIAIILSTSIFLSAIGMEWLFNIYEDYGYITVRSFCFQLLSLILMFVFVRKKEDYVFYALVLITSSVGSNILNVFRARRYIDFRIILNKNFFKHVKPMFYLFIMYAASSVYLVMDRSMLGDITRSDREVGLYGAAIKIHVLIFSVINTVRVIMTPRASYYMKVDKEKANKLNYTAVRLACMLGVPCAVGVFVLSENILKLCAGGKFIEAGLTLKILMLDVLFATINGVMINQIFIVNRKDKIASLVVIVGAVTNLILNSITIPMYGKEGAAASTLFSEFAIFTVSCLIGRDVFKIEKVAKQIVQYLIACIPIIPVYLLFKALGVGFILEMIFTGFFGGILYFVVLLLIKNELVVGGFNMAKAYVKKKSFG